MKQTAHKFIRLLLVFTIMCLPFFSQAQTVQVKGKITDASTGKPIEGATILVKTLKPEPAPMKRVIFRLV